MSVAKTCSQCSHWQEIQRKKTLGHCNAPLPSWMTPHPYEYANLTSKSSELAETCSCFTGDVHV